jgi:hypothetical protein
VCIDDAVLAHHARCQLGRVATPGTDFEDDISRRNACKCHDLGRLATVVILAVRRGPLGIVKDILEALGSRSTREKKASEDS